jgi:peptidoglycan/LPS O-acetylase OafA/YrhL
VPATTELTEFQSEWLDWARGLAAVAVLVYHVRYRFFADWSEIDHSIGARLFYTVTAFGHDAVMVFFVLSGLLISRSIFRAQAGDRWNWRAYLLARSTRLYLVLLPGLLLTFGWDALGLTLFPDHPIYTGRLTGWWHDFFDVRAALAGHVLAGNTVFLQALFVPTYGSNAPLWSLSYEFWFYIAFPLLWLALTPGRRPGVRVTYVLAGIALFAVLGLSLAAYFPLWLIGVGLWLLPRSAIVSRRPWLFGSMAALGFACVLIASHSVLSGTPLLVRDYLLGVSFAALVYAVLHDRRSCASGVRRKSATLLASQSYTLYVVHVPFLVFCRAWLGSENGQWVPRPATLLLAAVLTLASLAYAFGVSRVTEAHTDRCRAWLQRIFSRRKAGPTDAPAIALAGTGDAYAPRTPADRVRENGVATN